MLDKKYIITEPEKLKDLGFKKTKRGYRKTIGNLKLNVNEHNMMTVKQDDSKVFYINSFEKLDLLINKMINNNIILI